MQDLSLPAKQLSSGFVVVHYDGELYRLLALRSFSSWDFPKQRVDEGEDPLRSALQGTLEATGLTDLELSWGEAFRETVPFEDGEVSRYYLAQSKSAEVELRVPPAASGREDFEYRWVTAEQAEDVLPPRLAIILNWAIRQLASGGRQETELS